MIRVYCPTGPDTLMQNATYLGGHVDCLGPDSTGGCFAILGAADPAQIAYIQSLGITVIPSNMAAAIPSTIPVTAYTPDPSTGLAVPTTVDGLMQTIYTNNPLPVWHPDFA